MLCSGDEQIPSTTNMRSSSHFIIGKSRNAVSPFDCRPGWLSNGHSHGPCNPSGYVIRSRSYDTGLLSTFAFRLARWAVWSLCLVGIWWSLGTAQNQGVKQG
ncbi:hypothetical protein AVEN_162357-1 [Araneus ventricosus]|uniref:Uncharacterized protein n=1 Tax=Araneus ventricosus TaxID=182803 RepID=A0A4Y2TZ52_ARAVE|nr:hypothetical protein AVEN_162357-1 [Araneus ventricosus]